ncbi:MAG: leucine-rich repeat protein [Clostridia bacterium]|nr:leucine-rich repeat protein [Clostridia bacterium]
MHKRFPASAVLLVFLIVFACILSACGSDPSVQPEPVEYKIPDPDTLVVSVPDLQSKKAELEALFEEATIPDESDFLIETEGETCIILSYVGSSDAVLLPDRIADHRVVRIAQNAFQNSSIRILILPEGIEADNGILAGCDALEALQTPSLGPGNCLASLFGRDDWTYNRTLVPSGLKYLIYTGQTLEEHALSECMNLQIISFGEQTKTLATASCMNCRDLAFVFFSDQSAAFEEIGSYAFLGCTSLQALQLPGSLTKLGAGFLQNCNSLTALSVPFLGSCRESEDTDFLAFFFGASSYVFSGYVPGSLVSLSLTEGSKVPDCAFYRCKGLREVTLSESILSIGSRAFSECVYLKTLTLPENCKTIGKGSFYGCERLQSVSFPDSLETIDIQAFHLCLSLKEVSLPAGLKQIGSSAFAECISLDNVSVSPETQLGDDVFYHTPIAARWELESQEKST